MPDQPDMVLLHATKSLDVMPFFSEVEDEVASAQRRKQQQSISGQHSSVAELLRLRVVVALTGSGDYPVCPSDAARNRHACGESDPGKDGALSYVRGRPDLDMLKVHVPDISERQVLMCGPEAFMVAMDRILRGLGVASSAIHSEDFYF